MNESPSEAARIIRAWRERMGLTQAALADALEVTYSTVSRWENGHVKPSRLAWKALEQLAAARGGVLLRGDPVPPPSGAVFDHRLPDELAVRRP